MLSRGGSNVEQCAYDGNNRRIRLVVPDATRHVYLSFQWQDIEERVGGSASADRQFVWGLPYIDNVILRDSGNERLYAAQDANRSITATISSDGLMAERYLYAAYGEPTFMDPDFTRRPSSSYDWEMLFAGMTFTSVTGIYSARHRDFHFGLGAWLTPDLFKTEIGTSRYVFVENQPVMLVDPFGLDALAPPIPIPWNEVLKLIGQGVLKIPFPIRISGTQAIIAFLLLYFNDPLNYWFSCSGIDPGWLRQSLSANRKGGRYVAVANGSIVGPRGGVGSSESKLPRVRNKDACAL